MLELFFEQEVGLFVGGWFCCDGLRVDFLAVVFIRLLYRKMLVRDVQWEMMDIIRKVKLHAAVVGDEKLKKSS